MIGLGESDPGTAGPGGNRPDVDFGTVGIVGLGLIGGSLARDLDAAGIRVLGVDRDAGTLRAALESGIVAGALDLSSQVPSLDLVVLAVPVDAAPPLLRGLADAVPPDSDVVITDVGSTKRSIVRSADEAGLGPRFVGGHPVAGDHRSGWAASRRGLFRDATVWLCPAPSAADAAVARVADLWRRMGGRPRPVDAAEHDRRLALASHLPQATATALAATLADTDITLDELGPGGRGATRLAGSDPDLWTAILLDNADEIAPAVSDLTHALRCLAEALGHGDAGAVRRILARARDWRGPAP